MGRKQYWLKLLYRDFLSDEKIRLCSAAARGIYISLLCQAASSPKQGYLLLTKKRKPTYEELAHIIGVNPDELVNNLDGTLIELGLISRTRGGVLYFKNWRKYQRGRTLEPDCVGPKSGTALDHFSPLEEDEDEEEEKEKIETNNVVTNCSFQDDKSLLYVADIEGQEEQARLMWDWVNDFIPDLDVTAMQRFKDILGFITIGPMQILEIGKMRKNAKVAKNPSSYVMAECERLLEQHRRI